MSNLKSKQIGDFNNNVTWTSASNTEIPNSKDIQNQFVPEDAMILEEFTNQTISATSSQWTLTVTHNIQSNSASLVTLFVNGFKMRSSLTSSVSNKVITFDALGYDIDTIDVIEVHYIKNHTV